MNEPALSPAELAPPVPEGITPQQCIALWAESQGVVGDLSSVWNEAFPDEPLPGVDQ